MSVTLQPRPPAIVVGAMLLASMAAGEWPRADANELRDDPFQSDIRPTDPLSPDEQLATFRLPPGFEIQLFAAEPEIEKPINLAFDARGRLWVTGSVEYPYAAPPGRPARDSIRILEDTTGDGRADKVTVFAEDVNIPIGVYPWGRGAIAFSIPNIYYFEDTTGDGRADQRHLLYGPFDTTRDTHGMCNAFRRGFDGWLYACHGWANHSHVAGRDGHAVEMRSGNTFRIRLDGSRIEHFTWGQTNPFGMTFDQLGNLYTADCHSRPITMLIRGGYYEGLGTSHDGLGYVPTVMEHLHGSTAISGIAYYAGGDFPDEFRNNLFVGNVMTSRVHRDRVFHLGSTVQAEALPDFLTTSDPWFRPVDVRFGPDGAMYIADFYNRIIGHYEVPLDHPGRDRHRGRIWRVVYRGDGQPRAAGVPLADAGVDDLIEALADPQLTVRMLATDQLTDRIGASAVEPLRGALGSERATVRVHALWALERLGAAAPEFVERAARDSEPEVRVHVQRMLAESPRLGDSQRRLVVAGLADAEPFVQRAAVDALGNHPHAAQVEPLLDLLLRVPDEDVHLSHNARIALRNHLAQLGTDDWERLAGRDLSDRQWQELSGVAVAVRSPSAARLLINYLQRHDPQPELLRAQLTHIATHLPLDEMDAVARLAEDQARDRLDLQLELIEAVRQGVMQRGAEPTSGVVQWSERLARRLLESAGRTEVAWGNRPLPGARHATNPWVLASRPSADGHPVRVISSFERGETLTGILRSQRFTIPSRLSFYIAGHLGYPWDPPLEENLVRLRRAETDETIAVALAPRNDTAQRVEWELGPWAGQSGYLEIVDGIELDGYAWVAAGRFDPPVVRLPEVAPSELARWQQAAAEIARTFGLRQLRPQLLRLLTNSGADPLARAAAAQAIGALDGLPLAGALAVLLADAEVAESMRDATARQLAAAGDEGLEAAVTQAMRAASARLQQRVASELGGSRQGAELLLTLIDEGQASPRLLAQQTLRQRLIASGLPDVERRLARLTESLPAETEALERLVAEQLDSYRMREVEASVERGRELFVKHCAGCHRVGQEGSLIGPQLDGIATRGVARLMEDVLDPNRNVDLAFRTSVFILEDGRILSGLFRREEGETVVIADQTGEEISLLKSEIEETVLGEGSIMPDNFASTLDPQELADLIKYLLGQRDD